MEMYAWENKLCLTEVVDKVLEKLE